jgi:4-hydroxy-3-methylbut-2-enyl diphosphate reductase
VTKVHIEARRHAENKRHILLIGHAGHPEIEGTMGQVNADEVTLVETVEDARTVTPPKGVALAFATQTTLSIDDTAEIISVLQFRFPQISGPRGEDICYATTNRQKAVKDIAARVDLMLVIGAENSSNSKRLVEVAKLAGARTSVLVADKDAIDWQLVEDAQHIGLSAGASAPEILVEEVVAALGERFQIDVTEEGKVRETVNFKLPPILAS